MQVLYEQAHRQMFGPASNVDPRYAKDLKTLTRAIQLNIDLEALECVWHLQKRQNPLSMKAHSLLPLGIAGECLPVFCK